MASIKQTIQRVDSGSGTLSASADSVVGREIELKFLIKADSAKDAEKAGKDLVPLYYNRHQRTRLEYRAAGGGWYELSGTYANPATSDNYEDMAYKDDRGNPMMPSTVEFDTTGGTEHVTQAWTDSDSPTAYVGSYAKPEDGFAPDSYGAVNVSGDQVQGVDITVPSFQFTETWTISSESLITEGNPPLIEKLYELTGKVNSTRFRIFDPGEVLFLGCRTSAGRNQSMTSVTLCFSARPNRKNFFVGKVPVGQKNGWDYMWVQYETQSESNQLVRKPKYVYVDRVYEYLSFDALPMADQRVVAAHEQTSGWRNFYMRASQNGFPVDLVDVDGKTRLEPSLSGADTENRF